MTLGLEPGVDNVSIVGCSSFEAIAIFVAAAQLGLGYSVRICFAFFKQTTKQRLKWADSSMGWCFFVSSIFNFGSM